MSDHFKLIINGVPSMHLGKQRKTLHKDWKKEVQKQKRGKNGTHPEYRWVLINSSIMLVVESHPLQVQITDAAPAHRAGK